MKIAIINAEQHREIYEQLYSDNMYFNPILDKDGNMIITEQEIDQLTNQNVAWVSSLIKVEKDSQLKTLTKEEWIAEDIKVIEQKLVELKTKEIKPIQIKL
jgi:hypothetical protein